MIVQRIEHNRRRLRAQVNVCQTFWERGRGLLGRRLADDGQALLIRRCNAVHTIGMRQRIDVVFCAADGRILRIVPSLQPFRVALCAEATDTWEWRAGAAERLCLQPGDRLNTCC
ncbi:MAG: hypothetical protein RL026_2239 [Pseudomonadota bacterium]|jgi:uncharacterized membrane protein (UPF0127 family)